MAAFKSTATSAVALSIFMTGSAAFADVTAEQVWEDWKGYMAGFGYQVEATESQSGDALVVSDVKMSVSIPEEDADVSFTMSEMTFTNNGDGTVSISLPPVMPISGVATGEGETIKFDLEYATDAFDMTVSGDASEMTYDYTAALAKISLVSIEADGESPDLGTLELSVADIAGQSIMKVGGVRETSQQMTTGEVSYTIDMAPPEEEGHVKLIGSAESMGFQGTGSFPANMDPTDMSAMLAAGFAFDGGFEMGAGSSEFSFSGDGSTLEGTSSSGPGVAMVAMDADKLNYDVRAQDVDVNVKSSDLPFPVQFTFGEYAAKFLMPVSQSEEAQEFGLALTFGDFTMSDMIWGMFDPSGQLPRDPATVSFDLSGTAKMLVNLMDPEQMEAIESGETMLGELDSMNLNNLVISLAGAELTGEGAFTFDNEDLESFGGMPAPAGAMDLKLVGGNGLLDKLVAMGFVPEDQAMGARMMMGLFAIPGEGDDTLTSKIEVTEDGQVLANGQRLK
ncbi:hypothetical protein ROA7450_03922 [Roseovarius albus]|uniref:DUF2125 domain-containing protein n=1 Tax=Roseovarius albus TaxID=1247867 RepID=A0A1X7A5W6_9RHOB|nr:hypothetical protein [Roseovarius albus]SLN71469.1 hypothetical protein ROA7450_03922 [Roseovarius albus]